MTTGRASVREPSLLTLPHSRAPVFTQTLKQEWVRSETERAAMRKALRAAQASVTQYARPAGTRAPLDTPPHLVNHSTLPFLAHRVQAIENKRAVDGGADRGTPRAGSHAARQVDGHAGSRADRPQHYRRPREPVTRERNGGRTATQSARICSCARQIECERQTHRRTELTLGKSKE